MIDQLIQNNLRDADKLIQAVKRHMRNDHIEKMIAEALELLKATIELQEKRHAGFYVLGHQHKPEMVDEGPLTNSGGILLHPNELSVKDGQPVEAQFYNTTLGQPYESTRQPEPPSIQAWPAEWPSYYHSSEPCDMRVGHCSCGAYHDEGEFTLEKNSMGHLYIKREFKKWPGDHVGDGYNSACNCCQCKSIRTNAAMRDR